MIDFEAQEYISLWSVSKNKQDKSFYSRWQWTVYELAEQNKCAFLRDVSQWFCLFFGRNFSDSGWEITPHNKRNDANALHIKDICGDLDLMLQTSNFVAYDNLKEYKTRSCRLKTWALHHKKNDL